MTLQRIAFGRWLLPLLLLLLPGCRLTTAEPSEVEQSESRSAPEADVATADARAESPTPPVDYQPHTVLEIPAKQDLEGCYDLADPHVLKVGQHWYLYATNTKRDLAVWRTQDLEHWDSLGPVWGPTPGSWNDPFEVWAPHVEAAPEGHFYMYYTANHMIGVARADSPEGPFLDLFDHPFVGGGMGEIGDGTFRYQESDTPLLDFEEFAIDAFVLADSAGGLTFYCSVYSPLSVIRGRPMVSYTELAPDSWQTLTEPLAGSWEGFVNEGVFVTEHQRAYLLTYSGNGAETVNYGLGLAIGPTPLGPFVKSQLNPFLHSNPDASFYGPGHHSIAPGAHGDLLLFYHTKVSAEPAFDRRIRYVPISFGPNHEPLLSVPQP